MYVKIKKTPEGRPYWLSYFKSDPVLHRIFSIYTAWVQSANGPPEDDDAGNSFYVESDDDEQDDDNKSETRLTHTVLHRSSIPKNKRRRQIPHGEDQHKKAQMRLAGIGEEREHPVVPSETALSEGTLVDHDAILGAHEWSCVTIEAWARNCAYDAHTIGRATCYLHQYVDVKIIQ
jgi:hypothetical protein